MSGTLLPILWISLEVSILSPSMRHTSVGFIVSIEAEDPVYAALAVTLQIAPCSATLCPFRNGASISRIEALAAS